MGAAESVPNPSYSGANYERVLRRNGMEVFSKGGCDVRKLLITVVAISFLTGCGGGGSNSSPVPASGAPSPTPAPTVGPSGAPSPQPTQAPTSASSAFFANGRFIEEVPPSMPMTAARKFFFKGVAYSPTPIGMSFPFNSALMDSNQPIWSRDLALMRAAGVNAIRVYNIPAPPNDTSESIAMFLNAAWNNGNNPIYLLMDLQISGNDLLNAAATAADAQKFHDLDQKYARYPAVMGVAISNEIGSSSSYNNPAWWAGFNTIAKAAKQGFADGGQPNKIVTTSEADNVQGVIVQGEANHAAVDAWGLNIYRGRTFTNLFTELQQDTTKPVLVTEYGASAAYHPSTGSIYSFTPTPTGSGSCTVSSPIQSNTDVAELPATGPINMNGVVDYMTNNAGLLYSGFTTSGVVSGGFAFEWTDEWWKANAAGAPSTHLGDLNQVPYFPGCAADAAWYGLNSIAPGAPNALTPRPALTALTALWQAEPF